jgi:biopolymer transport protein ExbB/TolQ
MTQFLHSVVNTVDKGGPVVIAILVLSVILYTRTFGLLIHLAQARKQMLRDYAAHPSALQHLRILQDDLHETFQRQRAVLAAMIAAAPLLGLLGTVTGMIQTFRHLASGGGTQMMGGLADGISEALIATAAGLSVAIPAVLLLYFAHRELQRGFQTFAQLEHQSLEAR